MEEYQGAHPGRYEIDRRQVFGEVLPDSHFVTPLFGGSIHADNPCLLAEGKLVQQRLLCMIASTMATVDFCPALPELSMPLYLPLTLTLECLLASLSWSSNLSVSQCLSLL